MGTSRQTFFFLFDSWLAFVENIAGNCPSMISLASKFRLSSQQQTSLLVSSIKWVVKLLFAINHRTLTGLLILRKSYSELVGI